MKKRRTKLRKFLLRTLLFLLLLTGLTAVLLRSRTVQSLIAQKAAIWLSNEIGAKVNIKALDFDFFRNVHIEGVYMADRSGDTMIAIEVLDVQFDSYNSEKRRIDFHSAEITRGNVHIGSHKGEKGQNIQFLIDYINGPKKPRIGPPIIWTLFFKNATINDTRYVNFDDSRTQTEVGLLDEFNLQFNHINGNLKDLWIIDDSLHFTAQHLKTKERSGLNVLDMNAVCNIHYKGMDFTKLDLKTACSHINGEIHYKYPGYNYLDEFISNTKWNARLKNTNICLAELSIFDASFIGHKESLDVKNVGITGTFDHLRLNNLDIRMANETALKGDFYLEGLPDWKTTFCDFNIVSLRTNASELSRLLNGFELPAMITDAGNINAIGSFTGQFLDFKWNGVLNSSYGELNTNIVLNIKNGLKEGEIFGHLSSPGFDLGIINKNLGMSEFDLELDGKGLDASTFSMELKTKIPSFVIRGREFYDADIDGVLTAKNFTGKADFQDSRLNANFDGIIDFTDRKPIFKFHSELRGLDLMALNLDTTNTLVWGNYDVNVIGLDPDELLGKIDMENVAIQRNKIVYQFSKQHIEKSGNSKNTFVYFDGDYIKGNIIGRVSFNNIDAIAINLISNLFPDRIKSIDYSGKDSFHFDLKIPETALICSFIDTSLKTGPLAISGYYDLLHTKGNFNLNPMDLKIGDYKFANLDLSAKLNPDSGLDFRLSALSMENAGRPQFLNLNAQGRAFDGSADYTLDLTDRTGKYMVNLIARSELFKDSITLLPANSKLTLANEIWYVSEGSQLTILNNGRILCKELYLDGKDHFVEANGVLSDKSTDTLSVDFGNFRFDNLRPFLAESSLDSMEGRMNGTVKISALLGSPHFSGEIIGRDLKYAGQDFGDANLSLTDQYAAGRLSAECEFVRGLLAGVSIRGSIGYKEKIGQDQLALLIDIPKNTQLKSVQPFLADILTIRDGTMDGQLEMKGNFNDPKLNGIANIHDGRITIDYLNTNYNLNGSIISNSKGFFTPKPMILRDEIGNGMALINMSITHKKLQDFYLNLRIDSARNLKVLNTTSRNNDLYYGSAYADGTCRIFGPFDKISMDINLKNRKNSKVSLLYSDLEQNDIMGFVKFIKQNDTTKTKRILASSVINRIDIGLEVNQDLEAEFVIDKQLGDVIRGRGNAILRMVYDESENFYLYGNYIVNNGDYVFSIPGINVITRKIELKKGGTITWSGDPFDAVLNITGDFVKKISPSALMASASTSAGSSKSYAPVRIVSSLFIQGNLFSPDITFDIQAPDLESSGGGSNNDVYRVIQRIRADKDETMRQAVALLLFGNFIPPSFAQSANTNSVISGSGVAGNSLSLIASNVVNDIFTRLGIPTRIQVNIDDVKNSKGSTDTKVFINSEWFLSERIRLDLNYDPTIGVLVNSNLTLPLNFNLEYMTRNENWRIKAFSRSNNLLSQNTNITQTISGYTLGTGIVYRREFDTFLKEKKKKDSVISLPVLPLQKDSVIN